MTFPPRPDMVLSALEAALDTGRLPPAAREGARRLVRRLSNPVRVALIGLPGSGKSQLLNMLAGREVIPPGKAHPTLRLKRGPKIVSHLHFQGGRIETREGLAPTDMLQFRPARVEIEAPLPVLDRVSLCEIVADASIEGQRAAIVEAIENADMILWCSQDFSDPEPVLWNLVPEALRNHSFLVLTKADLLQRRGALRSRLAELAELVGESFHSVYPVATEHALAALARGAQDQTGFTGSGGRALVKAIYKHVDQGRQADLDTALLFLSRHAPTDGVAKDGAAAAVPGMADAGLSPTPVAEAPEPELPPAPALEEPVAEEPIAREPVPAQPEPARDEDWPGAEAGDSAPVPDDGAPEDLPAQPEITPQVRTEALAILAEGAAALPGPSDNPDKAEAVQVLESCTETLDRLTMLCAEAELDDCPFAEDVEEAAEMALLLQVEGSVGAAADAVTLLLQLRRGLAA
ncbi:energy-coupling factor transporter ATP-binding protein EcfA2 [Rhodovulum iodosum]|uniref:Energy-coupling factor transporter ATP-binding protein EcfA2 n=1 Tax=Rhodovulum iodosum TaxID=68291 RepID=A0ABV3XRR4_9RHOB|nr:hypothetical protein [Rhodovulum robiginosum]RSK31560.1 hypothetical protein EJA01_15640 [Rhodovulum robiginosum]